MSRTTTPSTTAHRSIARRVVRIATAAVVAGSLGVIGSTSAHALRIGPGIDPGPGGTIDPGHDAGVVGTVNLNGCVTAPANVRVQITGLSGTVPATVTSNGNGTYTYSAGGLTAGSYSARGSLLNGACPYGNWTQLSASFTAVADIYGAGPTLTYVPPAKVTRIPGLLVAAAAQSAVGDFSVRLHNLGPQHGASRHLANASSVTVAGTSYPFTVPEGKVDVDCGTICPDAGDGRFYVRDMRSNSVSIRWNTGLDVSLGFETSDREVKGFFTPTFTEQSIDSLMPDVEISNARLTASLVPVVNGSGGITLVASGTPRFDASLAATGPCVIFGFDVCDGLFGYKAKVKDAATKGAAVALADPRVQAKVSSELRKALTAYGVGVVKGVYVDADNLIIAE